jgi:hypothetical protein
VKTNTQGRNEGELRKADAFDLLQAHRNVYILCGRRALLTCLLAVGEATADDVREMVELPTGLDPKLFGAVPSPLAKAGIIRAVGYAKTCRPTAHARPLTVWRLADRGAAERWLSENPDPSEDAEDQADGPQGRLLPRDPNQPAPAVAAVGAGMEA